MNLTSDQLNFIALLISTASAAVAAFGLIFSAWEQRSNVKEDFLLWAMERLRQDELRKYRGQIYALADQDLEEAAQAVRDHNTHPALDPIRQVALSFDEIGYFVYQMKIVKFRDILDIYSQTVKIWNRVAKVIEAWRIIEGDTSFVYFEMLARQERLKAEPHFAAPIRLYGNKPSAQRVTHSARATVSNG